MTTQSQGARDSRFGEVLLKISNDLGFGLSRLDRALPSITEIAAETLNVERCGIWRLDEDRDRLICLDLYDRRSKSHHVDVDFWVAEHRAYFSSLVATRAIDANDALHDPRTEGLGNSYIIPNHVKATLDAPIRLRGEVIGVICNEQTSAMREWTEQEKAFAASLGDILATAFESADHERLQRRFLQAQKLDAVGRLAGGVAHDFNNLLTAIRGNLDLLNEALIKHPAARLEVRDEIDHMAEAIDRAAALTRQLLTFGGRQIQASSTFNANDVIHAMKSMLLRLLPENIELQFEIDEQQNMLCADPTLVEQIVLNLILNARDAMPEGGVLRLESRTFQRESLPYWQLRVIDSGVGMSRDIRALVFEPFFTTKEEGKGSGLGLSTVAGIVKTLGGQIRLDSQLGRGTALTIETPLTTPRGS